MNEDEMHPAVAQLLRWFRFDHLNHEKAKAVSERFHDLAWALVEQDGLEGPELTVALRKLLESKDAAVRAALD